MTIDEAIKEYGDLYDFDKKDEGDIIWWTSPVNQIGVHLISFDRKHVYNVFSDIPEKLTEEELRIFRRENRDGIPARSY